MFENDWDVDEDYFKDFNSDEVVKNFENENKEKKQASTLKPNIEIKEKLSTNTSRFGFNYSFIDHDKSEPTDTTSRKNAILDIFKNTDAHNIQDYSKSSQSNALHISFKNSWQASTSASSATNQCRKNLVLDIFQNNETTIVKNNTLKSKPVVKSVLKIAEAVPESESNLKRKKNVAFTESVNETNISKKICVSTTKNLPQQSKNSSNFEDQLPSTSFGENIISKSNVNDSRKQVLLELMKSPVQKVVKVPRIKQTVIRKFPGPAGILPDDIDNSEIINLDSLDENKNNKSNEFADVCSQNTKNLFSTGAWQLMMDDLPADFELYDVATVKENALEYSRTYKKVPYFAGIIQYIDYKPNDPHVILKDLSGKINALIHHSICKLYPNALGTNVVVLVKDVGLIVTSKKYVCVIITPKNLVSVYSDDVRLVETPHLEKLLGNNYNCNLHESQISILDETEDDKNIRQQNVEFSSEKVAL